MHVILIFTMKNKLIIGSFLSTGSLADVGLIDSHATRYSNGGTRFSIWVGCIGNYFVFYYQYIELSIINNFEVINLDIKMVITCFCTSNQMVIDGMYRRKTIDQLMR